MSFVEDIICVLVSPTAVQIAVGLIGAYIVYRLGLRAYVLQKQYERFQKRYLEQGMDLWSSQLDYALGVYRNNWALLLRLMKQYRDIENVLTTDDFFNQFKELDHSFFQIGPNAKIQTLLGTDVFWQAYQSIFSFVNNANNNIKADFGVCLNAMLQTENHPNKADFLQEAEKLVEELNNKSEPLYVMVSKFNDLIELLTMSDYTTKTMDKFKNRSDVKNIIEEVKNLVKNEDDSEETENEQKTA